MDLISDGAENTGQGIDKTEFGVSVALGEFGRIALANTNQRDAMVMNMTERVPTVPGTPGTPTMLPGDPTFTTPTTPYRPAADERNFITIGTGAAATERPVTRITVMVAPDNTNYVSGAAGSRTLVTITDTLVQDSGTGIMRNADGTFHVGDANAIATCSADGATEACLSFTAFVHTTMPRAAGAGPGNGAHATTGQPVDTYYAPDADGAATPRIRTVAAVEERVGVPGTGGSVSETEGTAGTAGTAGVAEVAPMAVTETVGGFKRTHVAVEFNVGGMTTYLGHSVDRANMDMMLDTDNTSDTYNTVQPVAGTGIRTRTTHYGVSGGLGDTGINFLVAARSVRPDGGANTSPWLFNVSKNLGGGATVLLEHLNTDNAQNTKQTQIALHVSF